MIQRQKKRAKVKENRFITGSKKNIPNIIPKNEAGEYVYNKNPSEHTYYKFSPRRPGLSTLRRGLVTQINKKTIKNSLNNLFINVLEIVLEHDMYKNINNLSCRVLKINIECHHDLVLDFTPNSTKKLIVSYVMQKSLNLSNSIIILNYLDIKPYMSKKIVCNSKYKILKIPFNLQKLYLTQPSVTKDLKRFNLMHDNPPHYHAK